MSKYFGIFKESKYLGTFKVSEYFRIFKVPYYLGNNGTSTVAPVETMIIDTSDWSSSSSMP